MVNGLKGYGIVMDSDVSELRELIKTLNNSVNLLQNDVKALTIHVEYLKNSQEEAKKKWWNLTLAAASAFIGVIILWVTNGGLEK